MKKFLATLLITLSLLQGQALAGDGLTDEGLLVLEQCESSDIGHPPNYATDAYHDGAAQWLQSIWDAAAHGAGFPQWGGVPVYLVPPEVQQAVTKYWWSVSTPSTQWPNCYDDALRQMGIAAPCLGRNIVPCALNQIDRSSNPELYAEGNPAFELLAPVPTFTG